MFGTFHSRGFADGARARSHGVERLLTYTVVFSALCAPSIGLLDVPFWLLSVIIRGAGIGIDRCQTGLNSLSGRIYPSAIRSTGAGWGLGLAQLEQNR